MTNSLLIKICKIALISLFSLIIWNARAEASISLDATPIQGGTTLRFGRMDVLEGASKEVRVRINTSETTQYQVFQQMIQPITSTQGRLADSSLLQYYALPGSNSSGTLYGQVPQGVSRAEELVYSSSGNGSSDRFVLVFNVNQNLLDDGGEYSGQLLLTLRPIGPGSTEQVYINVVIDAEVDQSIRFNDARSSIELSTLRADQMQADLSLSFEVNGGIKLYQEIVQVPVHEQGGHDLDLGAVLLTVAGEDPAGQTHVAPGEALTLQRQLIFETSTSSGTCHLMYQIDPDRAESLSAGRYRGLVRYYIQTRRGEEILEKYLSVHVEPIFSIQVSFPDGPLFFKNLLPGGAPMFYSVVATVQTNLGRPYQVTQEMVSPMVNEKGDPLDLDNFLIRTELLEDSTGKIQHSDFVPFARTRGTLFLSDAAGSPAEFRVLYQVKPYSTMIPGNYASEIRYSLGEM